MERRSATEQISADLTQVIDHVLRDEHHQYVMRSPSHATARLAVQVAEKKFANMPNLRKVVDWVLYAMDWIAGSRPLTAEEIRIREAARRVLAVADEMFGGLAELGRAISAKDWEEAQAVWDRLAPYHTIIIGCWPDAEYLASVLHERQTQGPNGTPPSGVIH